MAALSIISLGILFRLVQYLSNRSLWLDEAHLANNVIKLSYRQLTNYIQGVYAPIGFLWGEKFLTQLFGTGEFIFRLIPFLSGIISLILFYKLAQYFLSPVSSLIILTLFSLNNTLIYYSNETKQYTSGLLIGLILYLVLFRYLKNTSNRNLTILSLSGMLSIWFSHTSIILLTGISVILLFINFRIKFFKIKIKILIPIFLWLLNFAANYFFFLKPSINDQGLAGFWSGAFAPFPPAAINDLLWYLNSAKDIIGDNLLGFYPSVFGLIFIILGVYKLWKKDKINLLLLILPSFITLFISVLHLYPFTDRFLLFLVPQFLILSGAGLDLVFKFSTKLTKPYFKYLIWLIIIIFIYHSASIAFHFLTNPLKIEETRPILKIYKNYRQNDDTIYVYYAALPAYKYYAKRLGLPAQNIIEGKESRTLPSNYILDLNKLRGRPRVWIFFSHDYNWGKIDEERFMTDYLVRIGKLQKVYRDVGASIYLFNL